MDSALDGLLEWDIDPQSLFTDAEAEAIEREILATREIWKDEDKSMVTEIAYLLSCTRALKVVGAKQPKPAVFRTITEIINVLTNRPNPADLFTWRLRLPYKVLFAWREAFNEAQDVFSVDPAQLPTSALNEAQKAEAADNKSPLV
jgi:hypothetical protein